MPGAGKQPPEVQERIRELLEAGFDPTTIHRKLKVGRSSIYRMKKSLQQHGTAYMPTEMNKKNGRPKVLTAEQELEVREWLREPKNRNRYLDDLVWLIHDRFGIVCSTTTMSKLKRKWLHVIEAEETGQALDESTRQQVMETHPTLPVLNQQSAPQAQMMQQAAAPSPLQPLQQPEADLQQQRQAGAPQPELDCGLSSTPTPHVHSHAQSQPEQYPPPPPPQQHQQYPPPPPVQYEPPPPQHQQHYDPPSQPYEPPTQHYDLPSQYDPQIDTRLFQPTDPRLQQTPYHIGSGRYTHPPPPPPHHIDNTQQLEHQLQRELASSSSEARARM